MSYKIYSSLLIASLSFSYSVVKEEPNLWMRSQDAGKARISPFVYTDSTISDWMVGGATDGDLLMNFLVLAKPCEANLCHYVVIPNSNALKGDLKIPYAPDSEEFKNYSVILEKYVSDEKVTLKQISRGSYTYTAKYDGEFISYEQLSSATKKHSLESLKYGSYIKEKGADKLTLTFEKNTFTSKVEGQFNNTQTYTAVASSKAGSVVKSNGSFYALKITEENKKLSVQIDFGHPTQEEAQASLESDNSNGMTFSVPYTP